MKEDKYTATFLTVAAAMALLLVKTHGPDGKVIAAWAAIWPIFGASKQHVAALALQANGVWVANGLKKDNRFAMVPMVHARDRQPWRHDQGERLREPTTFRGSSIILLVLGLLMVLESMKALIVRQDRRISEPAEKKGKALFQAFPLLFRKRIPLENRPGYLPLFPTLKDLALQDFPRFLLAASSTSTNLLPHLGHLMAAAFSSSSNSLLHDRHRNFPMENHLRIFFPVLI